ncbi:MAG: radical SAM protein [Synechococcus sp. MED650]|nr:radical SAM protein [Synechococcus sp. MED650]OUW56765.1 MAG: radical SAM protein [Cyanobacteria bacterium TMED188]
MPYPFPPRSAYLHIPFCHRRCYYCDFAVVPLGDRVQPEQGPGSRSIQHYLTLLHREIADVPGGPPLATVYIGGGTPSLLSPDQIGSLLDALRCRFGLQPGAEITLEMDPASFDQHHLAAVIARGVNRISLGGQSFDDSVLEQLGRRHRRVDLLEAIAWMASAHADGVLRSWSLDLIQNLPGQTLQHWVEQLEQAVDSGAPHLSVYDLSVEPGTVFDRRQALGQLDLPEDDLAVALMACTSERLAAAGLSRYEISNHARPGHASRHNRVYWSGAGWWGFGMGATSAPWGDRLARPRTREGYAQWLEKPPDPVEGRGVPLDEQLLVGLRRREGVSLRDLNAEALERRWQPFLERGLLERRAGRWCLTDPEGMALSNQVLVELLLWWEECASGPPTPAALS